MKMLILSDLGVYSDALDSTLRGRLGPIMVSVVDSIGGAVIAMETFAADVLLLDVRIDGALPSVPAIRLRWPQNFIVAIGLDSAEQETFCRQVGVNKSFHRRARFDEVMAALNDWRGQARLSLPARPAGPKPMPIQAALSPRECEVAALLAQGLSNKAIARQLDIQLATVKNHVHNILQKLQVSTRLLAVLSLRATPGLMSRDGASLGA